MGRNLCGTQKEKDFYAAFGDPIKMSANVMVNMFAMFKNPETGKLEQKYQPDDLITVTEKEFPGVKPTTTTIGIYIANKTITEDLKVVGYVNKPFTKSIISKLMILHRNRCFIISMLVSGCLVENLLISSIHL